jgi:hypothetical protein
MTTTHYYKMLSGPVKKAERKPIQAYTNFQEKPAAGDQLRALQVIKLLCEKPRTLHELSIALNVHTRTVRRYCALIDTRLRISRFV